MNQTRIFTLSLAISFAVSWASAQDSGSRGEWAHINSRLRPDNNVRWGTLENGFRYVLLNHKGIPERVCMRLLVLVGSTEEENHELGIAHFLEHMAFNGTRNFKSNEMISFLQSLGMEHGYDVNATTSFDHTIYSLEYWDNELASLNKGLLLLRDICNGISFQPAEIEKERKVILSELRSREGFNYRAQANAYKLFFRGLNFAGRIPIGSPESIKSLRRNQFLKFYNKWYRADLMLLVVVGDFEIPKMEHLVSERFDNINKPSSPIPKKPLGRILRSNSIRAGAYRITDVGSAFIQAASVLPMRKKTESLETRRQEFIRKFSMALLAQRMQRALPNTSNGFADYVRIFEHDTALASLAVAGPGWKDGVQSIDRIIRMTLRDGFLKDEIDWLRKRELSRTQKLRASYSKLDPAKITNSIIDSVVKNRVYIGIPKELEWQEKFLQEINKKNIHRAFRECWNLDQMAFHVSGEVDIQNSTKEIKNAITTSRKEAPNLYLNQYLFDFEYEPTLSGNPGTVVESSTIPEFQAHLMRFQNNVRLNFIETQNEPGQLRAIVRIGGGLFDQNENMPGLREFGPQAFLGSGIQRYELSDVQSFISSSMLEFSFDVHDHDAFTFRGVLGNEDLDLFLGIVTDYLRDPRVHRSSYWDAMVNNLVHRKTSAVGIPDGYRAVQNILYGNDGRFSWGNMRDYTSIGVSDVRDWIEEPLRNGYIEVSIIGDISMSIVTQKVARTLGTLNNRRSSKLHPKPKHPIAVVSPSGYRRVEFVGEKHQAGVIGFWHYDQEIGPMEKISLEILARVIKTRMWESLREDLGLSYSPTANFSSYDEYSNFSTIEASLDCSPVDAPDIAEAILDISTKIFRYGVSQEEVNGSLRPYKVKMRQALRSNEYLINNLLKRAQERSDLIHELVDLKNGNLNQVSVEKVNSLARKIFMPKNSRSVAIIPKPFIGIFQIEAQ